ncbi:hypothetical protein MNBD_UNCLBAC01-1960 [hydrothermal vent metagenome]|uniref:Outer membrane lipoprotein BamD-like domain-containing protein n=1 Tax=hydrothermal vent metagenome TaxID=652676 RepID=A0A3B1DHG2_9ZZZZ
MSSFKHFYIKIVSKVMAIFLIFSFVTTPIIFAQEGSQELFLVAQKAFEDGFYDVAMRYIDQLLQEYPQTDRRIEANLLLGQCYFFKSQYLKAYDIFQKLLKHAKFKDATLFWLGETYLKGSDYSAAEKQYRELIKIYPKSVYTPQAYYSLGWVYFEQEKFAKSKEVFLNLIKNYPAHQLTEDASFKLGEAEHNLQEYENTIQYFKNYILTYPQSTRHAESYFYIAEAYYYLENYLTAATYYAKTAEFAYDHKLILMAKVSLGWCYLNLERFQLAQKYFDEAYQFSKEKGIFSDDVFLGQANLYARTKEHTKALSAYTQLIKQFPNSRRIYEAYLGQANMYYLLEDYAKAIMAYQGIIDQAPSDPIDQEILEKAYFGVAWAYLKAGDIDAAIDHFEAIGNRTQSQTVQISALTQIGDAYQDADQMEAAIEVYDRILNEYQDSPYTDYVQYRQGVALLKLEKIDAATLSFQSLKANFPDSKYLNDIEYYLAVAYFKKGNWTVAKEHIQFFIADLSSSHEFLAEANYILALSTFNLEEYKSSIQLFQKIIKNFPKQSNMIRNAEMSIAKGHYKLGDVKEGVKRFKILAIKYPQTEIAHEALIWLGDYYLEASNFDNAIAYYQQFLMQFPGSDKRAMIFYELGQAYQVKGEYDQAINAFKNIGSDSNVELYAKAKLAIANIFSKKFDPQAAIEIYQSIVETSPEFRRDAYIKLAEEHKSSEEYVKAIENYTKALESKRGRSEVINAQLQFYIGDMYEFLNQHPKAIEAYLRVPYLYASQKKWVIKAYLRIARIFEDKEKWDEAKKIYDKIIQLQVAESKFASERIDWIKENVKE